MDEKKQTYYCMKCDFEKEIQVDSNVIKQYVKCENVECPRHLFGGMHIKRDIKDKKLKVLWITDDFDRHIKLYEDNWARHNLDLKILNKWEYLKGYDLVLIDYGFIGYWDKEKFKDFDKIRMLQSYYLEGCKMAWCGGLGGGDSYTNAVKEDFPKNKFLHNLRSLDLHDIEWSVIRWRDGVDEWN